MSHIKAKILYLLPSYNIYGGTPKKTLDLMTYLGSNSALYVYSNAYSQFKNQFEKTGAPIYEGNHGKNIYQHVKSLLNIVDKENISIIHCQFFMGELLGGIVKLFKPKIKLVIAFVGSNDLSLIKKSIIKRIYTKTDAYIYISKYVKQEKEEQYPLLKKKKSSVIYNGTRNRLEESFINNKVFLKKTALLDIAGLTKIKNIQILIKALHILINQEQEKDIYLYIAGEGPYRKELESLIRKFNLEKHIFLLGYQKNIGDLLKKTHIFVHPCYKEGFGIAVSEAMLAEKPIIVSNGGALPEIIINNESGLVVDAHTPKKWAMAIKKIKDDCAFSKQIATNAKKRANELFSCKRFTKKYEHFYNNLLK